VAEGIEKKEELEFLRKLGCHQYQGFFFSRPVPNNELCELLSINVDAFCSNGIRSGFENRSSDSAT
jgi:EAL domain-containing protein (putative c-di-GMP-specific phosphodiesterase class I)